MPEPKCVTIGCKHRAVPGNRDVVKCASCGGGYRCEFKGVDDTTCGLRAVRNKRCKLHGEEPCKRYRCEFKYVDSTTCGFRSIRKKRCRLHGEEPRKRYRCAFTSDDGETCGNRVVCRGLCDSHGNPGPGWCYVCGRTATHRSPLAEYTYTDADICEHCASTQAYLFTTM